MESLSTKKFDKSMYHPYLFNAYKIFKKICKYRLYIALMYFAYEGFMAWE